METEVRVPEVGESVREALLAEWFAADGAAVKVDEPVFLLETDKITLEVPAEASGTLRILVKAGQTVAVGDVVGKIVSEGGGAGRTDTSDKSDQSDRSDRSDRSDASDRPAAAAEPAPPRAEAPPKPEALAPSVRRLVEEHGLDAAKIPATGPEGRLTRGDVRLYIEEHAGKAPDAPPAKRAAPEPSGQAEPAQKTPAKKAPETPKPAAAEGPEGVTRKPLSPIRRRIAERLLEAKRDTAMLTTFNEVDMGAVMELRKRHKGAFLAQHGVGLGITSFFVLAAVRALHAFPALNAFIEGDEVVYHDFVHMGIAIGAERGLVVPVLRHAQAMGAPAIERAIAGFADKVRENKLELSDLEGGTFSITNGGVFGSLLSTPILNPPQSAILGLHKVEPRPVVRDGQVIVRPMMYVALTYDHRLVDGRDAVQFLVRIKDLVEEPERLWLEV
ncbi:MAG: 2-oxoglutarate dehydrogenase complex dihydrolipoyllysine-residue succinyltransferase [Thermodesulfobacteriota bacterium]